MHYAALMHGLGSIGLFANRAFLPAFVTAMLLRFGHQLPVIQDASLLQTISGAPSWFTHDYCLWILGILSACEVAGDKVPEIRAGLAEVMGYAKTGMSILTYMGVVSALDASAVQDMIGSALGAGPHPMLAPMDVATAGWLDWLPASAVAGGTAWLAWTQRAIGQQLRDGDPDDAAGVQGLGSWGQDLIGLFGPLLVLLVPFVMLAVVGVTALVLGLLRRRAVAKEEKAKQPCPNCGTANYGCAPYCVSCRTPLPNVLGVGLLGTTATKPAGPPANHAFLLRTKGRCGVCGTRLRERNPLQACSGCGEPLFRDPQAVADYANRVALRLPVVLGLCFALGSLPAIGLVPGVVLYRLTLIAPLQRYVPTIRSMTTRWGLRLVLFILALLQLVPGLGLFTLPAMALLNYTVFRGALLRTAERAQDRQPSAPNPSPAVSG